MDLAMLNSSFSVDPNIAFVAVVAFAAFFVIFPTMASTPTPSPIASSYFKYLCFLCPPLPESDDAEDMTEGVIFLPKFPNETFETEVFTFTSCEDEETHVTRDDSASAVSSARSSDRTIKEGKSSRQRLTSRDNEPKPRARAKVTSVEVTRHDGNNEHDDDDDNEGFYDIRCASRDDCDGDDQSDASSLTMPSFLLRKRENENTTKMKQSAKRRMLHMLQRAVYASVHSFSLKNIMGKTSRFNANASGETKEKVPCCTCLILLMEPSSHTFEILPLAYYPGVSYVSDLLEQIPLQGTFNFRLRFQNYTGLMALRSSSSNRGAEGSPPSYFQLPQSKAVPIRYSCEFHNHQKHHDVASDITKSEAMMPLVAILPERTAADASTGVLSICSNCCVNMVERTEQLARRLLSDPQVLQRLEFLQDMVLTSSEKANEKDAGSE